MALKSFEGMTNKIDFPDLIRRMINAAEKQLGAAWIDAKPYAEQEFKKLTFNIQFLAERKARGELTVEQARLYFEIYLSATRIVLLTIEGLALLAVENAINAALEIARQVVNTALGWRLL